MASEGTVLDIAGEDFLLDGLPTYAGRIWRGQRVEGLLLNSRMIQGIFDDANPGTRPNWEYPDGPWDPERNTRAFVKAMPEWRAHGLLSFTVGLQGGSPFGYSKEQPWENSAFAQDGTLRPAYFNRLGRILAEADRLGMAPIVSLFYFGQIRRFGSSAAVLRALDGAVEWLIRTGYRNLLIEVANEVDHPAYATFPELASDRVGEFIRRVQQRSAGRVANRARRLLVGTSLLGGHLPGDDLLETSDVILLHGNGVREPSRLAAMVREVRTDAAYRGQPIVFNEDDHFDFEEPENHFLAALGEHASWGYFDYRLPGEMAFDEGYQSMPCNWGISSARKRAFFRLLAEVTGAGSPARG